MAQFWTIVYITSEFNFAKKMNTKISKLFCWRWLSEKKNWLFCWLWTSQENVGHFAEFGEDWHKNVIDYFADFELVLLLLL